MPAGLEAMRIERTYQLETTYGNRPNHHWFRLVQQLPHPSATAACWDLLLKSSLGDGGSLNKYQPHRAYQDGWPVGGFAGVDLPGLGREDS